MSMHKTMKMNKETAKKKEYLGYYEGMMKQKKMPMTMAQHAKAGMKGMKTVRTSAIESQLEKAGLSQKEIGRLRRKK